VLLEIDSNGFQRLQIQLLHIDRRRLQNQLKLGMPKEPVGILAVAAVGWSPRGLCVADPVWLRSLHAQEGLWRHGAGAYFNVERLLQDATPLSPKALKAEQQFLKS
jgi:hypothetical protein